MMCAPDRFQRPPIGRHSDDYGYDRLARPYRWLEWFAFGSALQDARFAHIEALGASARILTIGEGDGRCVAELARRYPCAETTAIDASAGMIEAARSGLPQNANVRFLHADVRKFDPPTNAFDAVVGLFVFDQFELRTLETLLPRLVRGLRPQGLWLHADFAIPNEGWRRHRARAWSAVLYRAFGLATDIEARHLAPVGPILEHAGLVRERHRSSLHGLVETSLYRRLPRR